MVSKRHIEISLLVGFILVVILGYAFRVSIKDYYYEMRTSTLPSSVRISSVKLRRSPPKEINLDVPFFPQAPYGDWSLPFGEACEEASSILVHFFVTNQPLDRETVKSNILEIVAYEDKQFGHNTDTNAEETAQILRDYFGHTDVYVGHNVTLDDVKNEVAKGNPVIVPVNANKLKNPFYKPLQSGYHMLVVKGFTADGKIITNDVGTRRGKDFAYDPNIFATAMHDLSDGGKAEGKSAMIVVYK